MAAVGSPDALRPPLPPLARYKRDVALRLQSQDGGVWHTAGRPPCRTPSQPRSHAFLCMATRLHCVHQKSYVA